MIANYLKSIGLSICRIILLLIDNANSIHFDKLGIVSYNKSKPSGFSFMLGLIKTTSDLT